MMHEADRRLRMLERAAGVIAVIAALVVLNGAWVNQHNWENISWRVAVASVLIALAILVEADVIGVVQSNARRGDERVPDFLRAGTSESGDAAETSEAASVPVTGVSAHEPAELVER